MKFDALTRDNIQLSHPSKGLAQFPAINDISDPIKTAEDYIQLSLAPATRSAYLSDLFHFESWGGSIPADPRSIVNYLVAHAESLAISTLNRRLASLAKVHQSHGLPSPTSSELVRSVMRGLRRAKGVTQKQAKPLLLDDLLLVLNAMKNAPKDIRDRALLMLGFAGGLRRSELVSLRWVDVLRVRQGLILNIRRSKTDQEGQGQQIGIPFGRGAWCPVAALFAWEPLARSASELVFPSVNRHGKIGAAHISAGAVCVILRNRLRGAGINPEGYSGHSLRAGFATSAAEAGSSNWDIRRQTRHASDAMLGRYIRSASLFKNNAAGMLF